MLRRKSDLTSRVEQGVPGGKQTIVYVRRGHVAIQTQSVTRRSCKKVSACNLITSTMGQ